MAFDGASTRNLLMLFGIVLAGAGVSIAIFVFPVTNVARESITEDVLIIGTTGGNCGVQTGDKFAPKTIPDCNLPRGTNVTISYQQGTGYARIVVINNLASEEKFVIIQGSG